MTVEAVTATGGTSLHSTAPAAKPKQTMDSEMFMHMLVIQMKNQDPTSPMDTNAMIGQTTQLAMMEKLTQLSSDSGQGLSLQMRTAAAALIGQKASYNGADGSSVTGVVNSVSFSGSSPSVVIDGRTVDLTALTSVSHS